MNFEKKRVFRENVYLNESEINLLENYSAIKETKKSKIIRQAILEKIANDTSLHKLERQFINEESSDVRL